MPLAGILAVRQAARPGVRGGSRLVGGRRPRGDRAQWREVRTPTLVLASWQDPTHPHSYAEILARTLPSAQLAELTPKTESEESHVADTQAAIAGFLDPVFWPAASEEATRR